MKIVWIILSISIANTCSCDELLFDISSYHNQSTLLLNYSNKIDTKISAIDLNAVSVVDLGKTSGSASYYQNSLVFDANISIPLINNYVVKTLPNVWKLIIPKHSKNNYQLEANFSIGKSKYKVDTFIQDKTNLPDGSQLLFGGIYLYLELDTIKNNQLNGTITVELK